MLALVVEPARPSFQLAGAGGTLVGMTAACGVIGLVIGIPVGIFAVYRRYRDAM